MVNIFSFRAELPQDVDLFLGELTKNGIAHTAKRFSDSRIPDVEVELHTGVSREVLLMATKDLPDIHVIQDTLRECPVVENSMERTCELPESVINQVEHDAFNRVMTALIYESGEKQLQSLDVSSWMVANREETAPHRWWLDHVLSILNSRPGVPGGLGKEQVDYAKSKLGELYARLTGISLLKAKRLTLPEKHALNPDPRPYTPEEITHQLVTQFKGIADYWANQHPDNAREATQGTVFSICSALDGSSMALPAFNLVPAPCPEDKDYHISEGQNYYVPCLVNERGLHDWVHHPENIPGLDDKGVALEPCEPEVYYSEPQRGFFEALFQDNFGVLPERVMFAGAGMGKHRAALNLMQEFFSQQTGSTGRGCYVHTHQLTNEEEDIYWDSVNDNFTDPVYIGSAFGEQPIQVVRETYEMADMRPRRVNIVCKSSFSDAEVTWLTNYFKANHCMLLILVADEVNDTLDGPILQY